MPKFIAIIFLLLTLSACDTRRAERQAAEAQLTEKFASFTAIGKKINEIDVNQAELKSQFDTTNNLLNQDKQDKKKVQDALAEYVLEHKAAVAALAATGAGIAGIVAENLDDGTKGALTGAGILGAAYCIFGDDSCADVAAKVTYFGAQIAGYKKQEDAKITKLEGIKQQYQLMEQEKAPLLAQKEAISGELSALKEQIGALACKRIFCI